MKRASPPHGAGNPSDLLGWLHGPGAEPEAKNALLGHLLQAASRDLEGAEFALELLLLALWPGLSVVRMRLRRFDRHGELEIELVGRLTLSIRQSDPRRIRRVAATLLRNVERDIRRDWIAESRRSKAATEIGDVPVKEDESDSLAPGDLALQLTRSFGEDGALLAAVHVAGFTQLEIARLLGLTHDAARKRCQRALARVLATSSTRPVPEAVRQRLSVVERADPRAQSGADG